MIVKILFIGALLYFAWALNHHKKNKSLTFNILIEYLLTAALAFILLMGVLY